MLDEVTFWRVRITVDIDENVLNDAVRLTGESRKSPAIARAVEEFVKRRKAREFGRMLREGVFSYPLTNDEVERQGL